MLRKTLVTFLSLLFLAGFSQAQKSEVTITLNEGFFDALLDSVYQNFDPPQFSLATVDTPLPSNQTLGGQSLFQSAEAWFFGPSASTPACGETIKVLRDMKGVRTAVRFRDGKVNMPIAFSGEHAIPLFGCMEFAGLAEANMELSFDAENQRLLGRAKIYNVNLNGTGGIGGPLIARLLQGTLDEKLNPIPLLGLDKFTIGLPIPSSGNLKLVASGARTEVQNGSLNVIISYRFVKA